METNYIGYLLNALDDDEHVELEAQRAESPTMQNALEVLRKAIDPLAADKEEFEPPADLAMRTVGLVAEYVVQNERSLITSSPVLASDFVRAVPLPPRPTPPVYPARAGEAEPPRYRKRNLAVVMGLAVSVFLVLVAGVFTVRQSWEVQACQNNMEGVYRGLQTYCDTNTDRFPQVLDGESVGAAVARMKRSGDVPAETAFICAGNAAKRKPQDITDYAYHLGYRDKSGILVGLERKADNSRIPIMADSPLRKDLETTPINHRKGQNILFADGKVEFRTSPYVVTRDGEPPDDIFLNTRKEPHAGTHQGDCVLGRENEKP